MVETAVKTLGSTRRREETLSTAQPAEANTLSTVESVAQGGFSAPEVLALALLALLALVGLGSIMLILAII